MRHNKTCRRWNWIQRWRLLCVVECSCYQSKVIVIRVDRSLITCIFVRCNVLAFWVACNMWHIYIFSKNLKEFKKFSAWYIFFETIFLRFFGTIFSNGFLLFKEIKFQQDRSILFLYIVHITIVLLFPTRHLSLVSIWFIFLHKMYKKLYFPEDKIQFVYIFHILIILSISTQHQILYTYSHHIDKSPDNHKPSISVIYRMSTLTSDELNYVVLRYLLESGMFIY